MSDRRPGRSPRLAPWGTERVLWYARWAGVVFAVTQALLYHPPPGGRSWAAPLTIGLAGVLLAVNLALIIPLRRRRVTQTMAAVAYFADLSVICVVVWAYLDNPDATQWVLFMIVQLEGAYRWEMRGAVGTAAAGSLVYTVSRAMSAREFGFVLTLDSLSYVIGLTAIQAVVVGGMAQRMRRERDASLELYETALALNAGLDRRAIMRGIVREAARLSQARLSVAWIPEDDWFRPSASFGLPPDRAETIRIQRADPLFGESSVGTAFRTRRIVRLPDARSDVSSQPTLEAAILPTGWRSVVSVPIVQEGEVLGVLSCYLAASGAAPEDAARLQALAALGAVAMSNAQALERERSALDERRALDILKDDFLSTVSHELRTPLTVVQGFATTLNSRWSELGDEMRLELVRRIESQARELHERIGDLLDFSRLQSGAFDFQPIAFDLSAFVRETVNRLHPSLGSHNVRLDAPPHTDCWADQSAVAQILENLMVNAARYSPDDTTIWVRVEQVEGWAEVSVRDEGIGVPDDEQGRIFERFYRGQRDEVRRIRGTGIGLAIVRELTEALGGRVWVDSVAGRGAVFTVRLPAVEATGPERPSPLGAPERSPAV